MLNEDGSHWSDKSACRGAQPETFFPNKDDTQSIRTAKQTCTICPVQAECLEHAITNGEYHGIWGGYTPEEREVIRVASRRPKIAPPESRFYFPHGTPAGYRRHHRAGETPCTQCQRADRVHKAIQREKKRNEREEGQA